MCVLHVHLCVFGQGLGCFGCTCTQGQRRAGAPCGFVQQGQQLLGCTQQAAGSAAGAYAAGASCSRLREAPHWGGLECLILQQAGAGWPAGGVRPRLKVFVTISADSC
jgi:hypothetical protein